jgi:hypothetical protein
MMDDDYDEDNYEGRAVVPVNPDVVVNPFLDAENGGTRGKSAMISDRESSYHAHRHNRLIREDGASYRDVMMVMDAELDRERRELLDGARRDLVDDATGEFKAGTIVGGDGDGGGRGGRRRLRGGRGGEGGGGCGTAPPPRRTTTTAAATGGTSSRFV